MSGYELMTLELKSSILFAGLPLAGGASVHDRSWARSEPSVGEGLAEGEEELFLFDSEELVSFDPDEGPRLRRPLPSPVFYGRRGGGGLEASAAAGQSSSGLEAGGYLFLQWRPRDEGELEEGLEWFARQAWWERAMASGPYFVRRLCEEGRLATQALRRLG